jgi:DNA-directed RNA polymerase subunit RPC12/RpoP
MGAVKRLAGALKEMRRTDAPSTYAAAGKTVRCGHCNSDIFRKRRVVVRGPLAHCLICVKCGLAMWFENAPSVKPT